MPNVEKTREKLIEFAQLEKGWRLGEGVPIDRVALATAFAILEKIAASGFDRMNAFPGIAGEVRVTAYAGADYYEFTVELDGSVTYVYEHEDEELENVEGLTVSEALKKLEMRTPATWNLYATSIQQNFSTLIVATYVTTEPSSIEGQPNLGQPETPSSIGTYQVLVFLLNANSFQNAPKLETTAITTSLAGRGTIPKKFLKRRR
ncbi:MAG: hypothetical protein MOB07_14875 [Acidobacteria bacterium]|nr:hypothetical protein [Acidobacteriota bacterium]